MMGLACGCGDLDSHQEFVSHPESLVVTNNVDHLRAKNFAC